MSYRAAASKLRKNFIIMTNTFEKNNLRVLNVGCKPYDDDDADLNIYIELEALQGEKIPYDLELKINLYDAEGNIYMMEQRFVDKEEFDGYDTVEITVCDDSHVLEIAESGRLYVARKC